MVGKILEKNKMVIGTYVGNGSGKSNGKPVEYDLTVGLNYSPSVRNTKTNRTFVLSWNDIINLAEKAGLFEEDKDKC